MEFYLIFVIVEDLSLYHRIHILRIIETEMNIEATNISNCFTIIEDKIANDCSIDELSKSISDLHSDFDSFAKTVAIEISKLQNKVKSSQMESETAKTQVKFISKGIEEMKREENEKFNMILMSDLIKFIKHRILSKASEIKGESLNSNFFLILKNDFDSLHNEYYEIFMAALSILQINENDYKLLIEFTNRRNEFCHSNKNSKDNFKILQHLNIQNNYHQEIKLLLIKYDYLF